MFDVESQIKEWSAQYGIDASLIRFMGYTVHGEAMGKCAFYYDKDSIITLHHKLEGHGCGA